MAWGRNLACWSRPGAALHVGPFQRRSHSDPPSRASPCSVKYHHLHQHLSSLIPLVKMHMPVLQHTLAVHLSCSTLDKLAEAAAHVAGLTKACTDQDEACTDQCKRPLAPRCLLCSAERRTSEELMDAHASASLLSSDAMQTRDAPVCRSMCPVSREKLVHHKNRSAKMAFAHIGNESEAPHSLRMAPTQVRSPARH